MLDDIIGTIIGDALMPASLKRYLDRLKNRSWLKAFLYVLWQILLVLVFGLILFLIVRFF